MTKTTIKTPANPKTTAAAPRTSASKTVKTTAKAATKAVAKRAVPIAARPAADAAKLKHKLVRDSFTIPKSEYAVLDALKLRAARLARPTKKSELLRAGIAALAAMSDKALLAALARIPSLKTGRPKGSGE